MVWFLSLILMLFVGCSKREEVKREPERQLLVSTYTVSEEVIEKLYSTKAYFEAVRDVQIKPEVSGRVTSIKVEEGDFVRKGQVLLIVDPSDYINTLNQLKAQLAQARSAYENQLAIVERRKELFERELIAREDYESARTQLKVQEEVIKSIEAQIETAKLNLGRTSLKAPFDGYVAQRMVNVGDYVNPSLPTFRIVSLNPIRLVFEIPQELLPFVKEGSTVKAYVEGVGDVEGRVFFVSPLANASRLITVKATVFNPKGTLKPNMYAEVYLSMGTETAFRIPERSLVILGNRKIVWKLEGDMVKSVPVDVVKQESGYVWIKGELKSGDQVVVENLGALREGMKVKVR